MSNIPERHLIRVGKAAAICACSSESAGSGNDGIVKLRKHGEAVGPVADSIKTDYSERSASSCPLLTKEKFND